MEIRIELLGGLRARRGEQVLARFRTRKTASLLAYLACHAGPQPREVLAEMLWPEAEPEAARHSLRTALSSLRRQIEAPAESGLLAPGALFRATHASIELRADAISTDVADFKHALLQSQRAADADERARWLERAVEIHHAPLLPGFYEDWAVAEELRLRLKYFGALRALLGHLEARCDWERALDLARRGVALDAQNMEAGRDLMRLLALSGARREALRHFDALQVLARRQGLALDAETRALARDIESGALRPHPSPRPQPQPAPVDAAPVAPAAPVEREERREFAPVPRPFNRFFGREDEMALLSQLLGRERLVTISGAGGSGKTRLALEVASRLQRERAEPWRGAMCFVPLADLQDARLIPDAILGALKAARQNHIPPLEPAVSELCAVPGGAALLLLDNFEHLAEEGTGCVRRLLERVPGLQVLVTSRRLLRLRGEREMPLAPLPIASHDGSRGESEASVALFVDRARLALPDFALTPRNAQAIAALCRVLEGVPLAIELAAARAASLSPARMLDLLRADLEPGVGRGFERFDILRARERDAPERHRTLRAVLDWSFQLLDAPMQRALRSLWVFRGGFTADAARAVCGLESEDEAARALETLRECSLLTSEAGSGEPRFRMLETVRQFALERALSDGEHRAHRERHGLFFVGLAQTASEHFLLPDAVQRVLWVERLRPEHDNLRAALAWSLEHDSVAALRLACALENFCGAQLTQSELEAERALERAAGAPAHLIAGALGVASIHAANRGDFARQSELARRRWSLVRAGEDEREKAWALFHRGGAARSQGRHARARAHLERGLAIFEGLQEWQFVATTLNELGNAAFDANDLDAARGIYERCERAFARTGDRDGVASALAQQGEVSLHAGDLARAERLFGRVRAIERELDDGRDHPWRRHQEGKLATAQGDFESAHTLLARSLRAFEKGGNNPGLLHSLLALGVLAQSRGDAPLAVRLLCAADAQREILRWPMPLFCQASRARSLQQARAALGEFNFQVLQAEGRALTLRQAVERALREEDAEED